MSPAAKRCREMRCRAFLRTPAAVRCIALRPVCLCLLALCGILSAHALPPNLKAEHDPVKRSELALTLADQDFETARSAYGEGAVQKGDAQLEDMTNALNECVSSLHLAHKSKFYKKPEMRVALLQRRLQTLLEDIGVEQRGWAEYTLRKLNEIHDKLLAGALGK